MCAIIGTLLSVVTGIAGTVASAAQAQQQQDEQFERAVEEQRRREYESQLKLQAERDKASAEATKVRESALLERLDFQQKRIQDVGKVVADAAATGTAGASIDNMVADMYRAQDRQLDVNRLNETTQLHNIANDIRSQEQNNRNVHATRVHSSGGPSAAAVGIDIAGQVVSGVSSFISQPPATV